MKTLLRYRVRKAETADDLRAAQALRYRCFVAPGGARPAAEHRDGLDIDRFDPLYIHVLIEGDGDVAPVATFRARIVRDPGEVATGYAAQFYGLEDFAALPGAKVELGRFCIDPAVGLDADVLRLAWAALTRIVVESGAVAIFGCSSFAGLDPAAHAAAFGLLAGSCVAPPRWRPRVAAPEVVALGRFGPPADRRGAISGLPPLLRFYLSLGGQVSDHAVIDRDLGTLHVFTALEIDAIPPARRAAMLDAAART